MDVLDWQLKLVHRIPGEPLRFRVDSAQKPVCSYIVDLGALKIGNRRNGQCECDDFKFRRLPMLRLLNVADGRTRCKHIKWALAFLAEMLLTDLAKNFERK